MGVQKIADGFKALLSQFSPVDIGECDETLIPQGGLYVGAGNCVPVQPGVPDWRISMTFSGLTTADEDRDKKKINALFTSVGNTLEALTPARISAAIDCNAALFYCTSKTAPDGGAGREFAIVYDLIVTDTKL